MNAERVWQFWQRLLADDSLLERVRQVAAGAPVEGLFEADERAAAEHYARHLAGTELFVTTYRFRMLSAFGHCLQSAASLTYRALVQSGADLSAMASAFQAEQGWKDYGPYVYTACDAALEFVAHCHRSRWHQTPALAGLLDLIALERAAVALARRLADASDGLWSSERRDEGRDDRQDEARLVTTGTGQLVETQHALSAWLRDRGSLGVVPLPREPEWYVAYYPTREERVRYLRLDRAGALTYEGERDDPTWRRQLLRMGVLKRAEASA